MREEKVGDMVLGHVVMHVGEEHQILRTSAGRFSIVESDTGIVVKSNIRDLGSAKSYLAEIEVGSPILDVMETWMIGDLVDPAVAAALRKRKVSLVGLQRMDQDDSERIVREIDREVRRSKSKRRWPAVDELEKSLSRMGKTFDDLGRLEEDQLKEVLESLNRNRVLDRGYVSLGYIGGDKSIVLSPRGRYVIEDLPTKANVRSGMTEKQLQEYLESKDEDFGYQRHLF